MISRASASELKALSFRTLQRLARLADPGVAALAITPVGSRPKSPTSRFKSTDQLLIAKFFKMHNKLIV
jgi:hypothetical protein